MHERRLGFRIPFESMVTSYVHDRPIRGLATNLSDTGLNMSAISMLAPPPGLVVGLEIDLPGIDESIWASGQICYRKDDRLASGSACGSSRWRRARRAWSVISASRCAARTSARSSRASARKRAVSMTAGTGRRAQL